MKGSKLASDVKFYLDYFKWNDEENKGETWTDAVDRVMEMHKTNPKFKEAFLNERFNELFNGAWESYKDKNILGSQRGLQFGGDPIMKHNEKMFNCLNSPVNRISFFQECLHWLLCGCGVGFSVQKHHIAQLPKLVQRSNETMVFVVPDTIEGWADSLGVLLSSYSENDETFPEYKNKKVVFDYSLIRPKGAKISGGFKAPGPDGLRKALEKIEKLLDKIILENNGIIKPINAYDIITHSADAVLSGGVRRSATICFFSYDDKDMLFAKTGNWFTENPQRARSNNSVVLHRKDANKLQFNEIFEYIKQYGEPGFFFVDDYEQGSNPCFTENTMITTNDGLYSIKKLLNNPFTALVDGKEYKSLKGFYKTGEKEVFKISFKSGREVEVTENHLFLTDDGWKEVKDITSNDNVIIHNHRAFDKSINADSYEYNEGYLLGSFMGDGNISDNSIELKWWGDNKELYRTQAIDMLKNIDLHTNHIKDVSESKSIYSILSSNLLYQLAVKKGFVVNNKKYFSKDALNGNFEYLSGIVGGYFDADGCAVYNPKKGNHLKITSTEYNTLQNIQNILNTFGIYSNIYKNRQKEGMRLLPMNDGSGNKDYYFCNAVHELYITGPNINLFKKYILIKNINKAQIIDMIIDSYTKGPYATKFIDNIISKESIGIKEVFDCTVEDIHAFDANGIYVHNCLEISLYPWLINDETGEKFVGWQGCNLTTMNGGKLNTKDKFLNACKYSAVLGTIQAAYTDFVYCDDITKQIFDKEALLGCSITGVQNNPQILLDKNILREGAELIKKINKEVAAILGINQAARTTCIKPEGNASVLLETASGCHADHAPMYFRTMQVNKESEIAKFFIENYPELYEESVWSANKTDIIIYFPIVSNKNSNFKSEYQGLKQLEVVKLLQENWVETGTNIDLCVKPYLRHNVSNTVEFTDLDELKEYVWENKGIFTGVSFLPSTGDRVYNQAPFTSVITGEEIIEKYGDASLFASGLIVDGLHIFENLWQACDLVINRSLPLDGNRQQVLLRKDWIKRAKQFAKRYFKSDLNKMTICLKDVHLLHKWNTVNRILTNKEINFDDVNLQPQYTDIDTMGAASCYGGACELPQYVK